MSAPAGSTAPKFGAARRRDRPGSVQMKKAPVDMTEAAQGIKLWGYAPSGTGTL